MTVKELRDLIKNMPEDATVYIQDDEGNTGCLVDKLVWDTTSNLEETRVLLRFSYIYTKRGFFL